MTLKTALKELKLNESKVSTILGVMVLVLGAIFIFNYFREKGITLPGLSTSNTKTQTNSDSESSYTVVKGETLWQIAQKEYGDGYKWNEIAKFNNISNANQIEEGQVLKLPKLDTKIADNSVVVSEKVISEKTSENNSNEVTSIEGSTYVVLKGDSLWNIAVKAYGDGYKWSEIWKANKNIIDPNLIYPDTSITLPR